MPTIAVTGATGNLGRLTIDQLLERGVAPGDVVAVVRDPARAADLAGRGVDVRVGDYADPATLPAALAGVEVLLLVSGGGRMLDQHRAVIAAAERAGVRRVVYTSALRAGRTTLAAAAEHRGTEELLEATGVEWTVLRNGPYVENRTDRMAQFLAGGEIVGATAGRTFTPATRADYAGAAAAVLVQDGHAGATYELGGTPVTMSDLAAAIADATGAALAYRDVGAPELVELLEARGVPRVYAAFAGELDQATAVGAQHTDTGDLQRLLGRAPTTLADAVAAEAARQGLGR